MNLIFAVKKSLFVLIKERFHHFLIQLPNINEMEFILKNSFSDKFLKKRKKKKAANVVLYVFFTFVSLNIE